MRRILLLMLAVLLSTSAFADTRVRSYHKKNGTYVASHQRSHKDKSKYNNYSTKGNVNPYTGKRGTKTPR